MNLRYVTAVFSTAILGVVISGFSGGSGDTGFSTGAPPAHTGAPDEQTCARSTCHSDGVPNSGTANASFRLGNDITAYQPGVTYDLSVLIQDAGIVRFGYSIIAIIDADSSAAGEFTITDADRTQIFKGLNEFSDKYYLTYTYNGTNASSSGEGKWDAQWTAPTTDVGPITFYLAAVSANNDQTDDGDDVYTAQYPFIYDVASNTENKLAVNNTYEVKTFGTSVVINSLNENLINSVVIYSLDGKEVMNTSVNSTTYQTQLDENIAKGIYLLGINLQSENPKVIKFMLN